MLLRSSISNTKKFFQKTLGNLKGFFSGGNYQKLPKSPGYNYSNPFPYAGTSATAAAVENMNNLHTASYKELDKLYTDFTDQWDNKIDKIRRSNKKKVISSTPTRLQDHHSKDQVKSPTSSSKSNLSARHASPHYENIDQRRKEKMETDSKKSGEVGRGCLVAEKLKELEMLDMSNVDHVLDIEEVRQYYSRLTCPAYVEIVDRFFMDMYAEFFDPAVTTPARSISSRLRPRSVRSLRN